MVLNKTTYDALNNENVRLANLVDEQKSQSWIIIFSFSVVVAALVVFILLKKENPAGNNRVKQE